jgi:hypothetical protein
VFDIKHVLHFCTVFYRNIFCPVNIQEYTNNTAFSVADIISLMNICGINGKISRRLFVTSESFGLWTSSFVRNFR